jgi:Haem-binding domain
MSLKTLLLGGIGLALAFTILLTVGALLYENNPAVVQEPAWNSPQTRQLAQRACFDCHSNQTQWPWYDKLPVSSWLAALDTFRGRRHLNFSEWGINPVGGERGRGVNDVIEVIQEGSMPPNLYTLMHPNAKLTPAEKQQLIDGLLASLK